MRQNSKSLFFSNSILSAGSELATEIACYRIVSGFLCLSGPPVLVVAISERRQMFQTRKPSPAPPSSSSLSPITIHSRKNTSSDPNVARYLTLPYLTLPRNPNLTYFTFALTRFPNCRRCSSLHRGRDWHHITSQHITFTFHIPPPPNNPARGTGIRILSPSDVQGWGT